MSGRCAVWATLAMLGGCQTARPLPVRGPLPHSVLVLPVDDELGLMARSAGRNIADACGAELRELGYRVATPERWWPALDAVGLLSARASTEEELAEIGRVAHVDAVLRVRVRGWSVLGQRELERLDYDLEYELWSTALGFQQWQHRVAGHYERSPSAVGAGEFDLVEDGPATTPVQGGGWGGFRSVDVALHELQRWALARLPSR